jgi:hypothetical protein
MWNVAHAKLVDLYLTSRMIIHCNFHPRQHQKVILNYNYVA